jgi:hypothetical protein
MGGRFCGAVVVAGAFFMGVLWDGLGMGARRAPLHVIKNRAATRMSVVRKDKAACVRFFFVALRDLQRAQRTGGYIQTGRQAGFRPCARCPLG